jgi:hypothetical protein
MTTFWDHLIDLIWAPFLVIVTWAFQLDRRVSRLETQREAMVETIAAIKEDMASVKADVRDSGMKLDKLMEKLL